ncbi:MAG: glycosyltransferase family 2 protein [Chloroflexi bacterium]|nr:glycosyltransferase family 2 protein [Chloroflexota bacterium]
MTTLSIVIPAYNEEDGIAEIVTRVLNVKGELKKVGIDDLELIVVDDGSRDRTVAIVESISDVRLIRHLKNKGYGAALKTGFAYARGELIGFLDADGTYPPEYFPKLCEQVLAGSDLVIGSRMAGAKSEMPLTRRIGNVFFAGFITLLGRQRITDSASGMRVFRKEVLEKVYPLPDGLNLTPIMSTRALHEQVKMTEIPIPYSERVGRSKLSVIRDGSIYLQSITWTVLNYNPVRVLGMIGLGGVAVAQAVAIGLVIARLGGTTELGPWGVAALFWALLSGVIGVSVFSLGVTFNYLVSLFHKRPIRQGLFGRPIFKVPLENYFGWIGAVSILAGLVVGIVALALGIRGWEITRLWFYLLASAMAILVGIQLVIYLILLKVLDELSKQEALAKSQINVDDDVATEQVKEVSPVA